MKKTTATRKLSQHRIGIAVECGVCGHVKKPIGRSAPLAWYGCDFECEGHSNPPYVGSLWPGESEASFGYPVTSHGTTDAP